jgi:hypothetical protein
LVTNEINLEVKQTCADDEVTSANFVYFRSCNTSARMKKLKISVNYFVNKIGDNSQKNGQTKARFVVRVFEVEYVMQSDSPTVGKGTLRTFLTLSAVNKPEGN